MSQSQLIDLSMGHPFHQPPASALAAVQTAAQNGVQGYLPTAGLPALRERLRQTLQERHGITAALDDVVVTAGSTAGLLAIMAAAGRQDATILVPDPGFPLYDRMAQMVGLHVERYRIDPETLLPDCLDRLPPGGFLLWNSPHNPLGRVASPAVVEAVVEAVRSRDLWLLSDEAYADILFQGSHVSPARLCPERTYSVHTFSKGYGMAGWRIGYVAAPPGKGEEVARCHWTANMSVSSLSQWGALGALQAPPDYLAAVVGGLRERLDIATAWLDRFGIPFLKPASGFFIWADMRTWAPLSDPFVKALARTQKVLVTPGSRFGPAGEGFVRICFSVPDKQLLAEGVERMGRLVSALRPVAEAR